jgi:hypothetical protein
MKSDPTNGSSVTNPDGPMKLIPGQNVTVTIEAKPFNNLTNVWFESGAVYDLKATGTWFDAGRPSGPNGYPDGNFLQNLASWLRRLPDRNWFILLGVAEPKNTPFVIGTNAIYQAQQSGQLICFANDVPGFYWNNTGALRLTIARVR